MDGEGARPAAERRDDPAEAARIGELQRRVWELKQRLVGQHAELREMRRELERAEREGRGRRTATSIEGPPQGAPAAGDPIDSDPPEGEVAPRAPQVPVYADRLAGDLSSVPRQIAAQALRLAAGLAAADGQVWSGVKRQRSRRELFTLRVGLHHRLICSSGPKGLTVAALIHRKELERTLARLSA